MSTDKIIRTTIAPCQQDNRVVTDADMYVAFAAEHLADAIRCLSQAIGERPAEGALGYLNDMLERWRRYDLPTLEAEAKTTVTGERP